MIFKNYSKKFFGAGSDLSARISESPIHCTQLDEAMSWCEGAKTQEGFSYGRGI